MFALRRSRTVLLLGRVVLLVFVLVAFSSLHTALAATNQDVVRALIQSDAYVTPERLPQAHLMPGDQAHLQAQADQANAKGIPEQFAIVAHFRPEVFRTAAQAATALRNVLDFSGVLIIVSPLGIGVGSDQLTAGQDRDIEQAASPRCAVSYTSCAIFAGQRAVTLARADKNAAFHDAAVFWSAVLTAMALAIVVVVLFLRHRTRAILSRSEGPDSQQVGAKG